MIVGAVAESFPNEKRVALSPAAVKLLKGKGLDVHIESGCGAASGFADDAYIAQGAKVVADRKRVFADADLVCQVRTYSAGPRHADADLRLMRAGQCVMGFCEPLTDARPIEEMARTGARAFAVELMPRTTRAQSMDALSSQALVAGHRATLLGASLLGRMFPLMMTAAGTVPAAHVLVIGAGVAGLSAVSTARRLGAVVSGYDIRPAVKQEVESLGAKFLMLDLPTHNAQDRGGYARAMDDSFYKAQRELMAHAVAHSDVVITTAAVPGKRSPVLITGEMVAKMPRGSVIVDLAAERGGNCELTQADRTIEAHGVTVAGPTNIVSEAAGSASLMYARNLAAFVLHMVKDGAVRPVQGDEILTDTLLTDGGRIVQPRVREILGLDGGEKAGSQT